LASVALLAVGDGWRYAVPEGARVLVLHTVRVSAGR